MIPDVVEVNQGVHVTLAVGEQLDVIDVEEVADGRPISEFVPLAALVDDLTVCVFIFYFCINRLMDPIKTPQPIT